jgi:uncharacterized phage-associated protein
MLINHDREKLIQSINFFIRNTRKCGKVKLFKLLYFLDFEHFKATGRSVTGLDYYAWKMGPVPVTLFEEIESPQPDLAEALRFEDKAVRGGSQTMLVMTPQIPFSDLHFSKRELDLMTSLAEEYRDAESENMIEATHLESMPWDKIYNQLGNKQDLIPYELATRVDERDVIMRVSRERKELLESMK